MLSHSKDLIIGKKNFIFGLFSRDVCCVNAALVDLEWDWFLKSCNSTLMKSAVPIKLNKNITLYTVQSWWTQSLLCFHVTQKASQQPLLSPVSFYMQCFLNGLAKVVFPFFSIAALGACDQLSPLPQCLWPPNLLRWGGDLP